MKKVDTTAIHIRRMKAEGLSALEISNKLAEKGITTTSGKPISRGYVYTVLSRSKVQVKKTKAKRKYTKRVNKAIKGQEKNLTYFATIQSLPVSNAMKLAITKEVFFNGDV